MEPSGMATGAQRGCIWSPAGWQLGPGGAATGARRDGNWGSAGLQLGPSGAATGRRDKYPKIISSSTGIHKTIHI